MSGLGNLISSVKRYADILGWLLADIWSNFRGVMLTVFGLDVLGLVTMAGAYGLARDMLSAVKGQGGAVRLWGQEWSVLSAIGVAAGLILLALLVQSGAHFVSRRLCLGLVGRYEAVTVARIWKKMRELRARGQGPDELDPRWLRRMVTGTGRALGTCARLGMMSVSGMITAVFFGALAVYFAPRTALIFLVVGVGTFWFMLRNNRLAALASRRSRELGGQARADLRQLFDEFVLDSDETRVEERLHRLYGGGLAFRATEALSEQRYRVYQSQFLMSAGAAFAIALALLLPLLERPHGGAAVPVAMTAAGLVLLKQAFGFAGNAAVFLTRLNLKYLALVEHRRFLRTGQFPQVIRFEVEEEEEEE